MFGGGNILGAPQTITCADGSKQPCAGGSEETELGQEEQGHQYFERGNYVAAASVWIGMVEHYTTPMMGRFTPSRWMRRAWEV